MENAHLRFGLLEYVRMTEKASTRIRLRVDRYIGEDRQAHLLSVFGNDSDVGAITAAVHEKATFNLAFPERVAALMVFDCGPGYKKDAPRAEWNRTAIEMARAFESNGLAALSTSAEAQVAQHRNARGLAHAARGMLTQKDSRVIDSLPSIRVPTLVLSGAEDQPFLQATDYMAAKVPGAEKVILKGAGHAANIDQPAAFNAAVRSFLDRATAQS